MQGGPSLAVCRCRHCTYRSTDVTPTGELRIYLKDAGSTPNADHGWTRYSRPAPTQVWAKPQPNGKLAVYAVNAEETRGTTAVSLTLDFATLGFEPKPGSTTADVRDIWARQELGKVAVGVASSL